MVLKNPAMKKLLTLTGLLCSFSLLSQDWAKTIKSETPTFFELQNAFNEYYKTNPPSWNDDGEYARFKRWEYFMEPRVDANGNFPNADATWQALKLQKFSAQKGGSAQTLAAGVGTWSPMGPQNSANGTNGVGRVDCIAFDPTNSNTVWLGAAGGGLWKSTTGGSSWTDMNANIPNLSIADIAINPAGTNTMYIATGDGFGYIGGGGNSIFWGGTYSSGVMKSTDGGVNWTQTPLSYTVSQRQIVNRLLINPVNPNILIAVGTDGINRTTNGGTSWTKVKNGRFYDVEFNTNNPNIVYAVKDSVFKSVNGGATWTYMAASPTLTGSARVSIETTPADSNYIYILNNSKKLWRTTNGGTSWTQMQTSIAGLTLYGYYDCVLAVSPVNKDEVVCAGLNTYKSTDGGTTFSTIGSTIHSDQHVIEYLPASATMYIGNDGGIYRSTNGGVSFTNLTSGLQITQFYRIATAATNTNVVFGGAQDNGTLRTLSGTWSSVYGGDGMDCLVDHTNANNVYVSSQNGNWAKSTTGGGSGTFNTIPTGAGAWIAPLIMHPTNNQILFYGNTEVRKSTNGGTSFANISTGLTTTNLVSLAIAKTNPNYIYAANHGTIFATTNGGTTWNNISAGLPSSPNIMRIAVSSNTETTLWVSLSNYNAANKVFKSMDAGATWTNMSTGLPNIPANCITYDNNSAPGFDALYVGTDLGVYYRDSSLTSWTLFSGGLPNVIVDELEINYSNNRIYAATYGRGLWSSPTNTTAASSGTSTAVKSKLETKSTISIYPNPNNGVFNLDINSTKGNTKVNVNIYNLIGELVYTIPEENIDSKQYQIDLSKYSNGIYLVKINTGFESRTERIIVNR